MKIRPITSPEDMAAVIGLAYAMHQESNFSDMEFSGELFAQRLAYYASNADGLTIIAEQGGAIVGGLLATVSRSDFGPDLIAVDRGLFVAPTSRGGIAAKKLVEHYTAWAQSLGAKRISIDIKTGVNPDRTAAFLGKLGYRSIGQCLIYQE